MSDPKFLTVDDLMRVLLAELPEGVYPEDLANDPDPNKRSVSSSELRAYASILADLSANLEDVYENKFVSTVQADSLTQWERNLFATFQDASIGTPARQTRLLAKRRLKGGISLPAISAYISAILTPLGLTFQILPYSGQTNGSINGAWILGSSELGVDTLLAELDPIWGVPRDSSMTPLDNNLDYAAAGLTLTQLQQMQRTAYLYEVQIFGTADAATLALLDQTLTVEEPARSSHVIRNDVSQAPPDPAIYQWNVNYLPWWIS
jgi:uncharacterized protein YmfQ (DUF2313 family)